MSDEAKKKADAPAAAPAGGDKPAAEKKDAHGAPAAAGGGGLMTKTPVLIGGVMIIEAAVLFAGFKFLGNRAPAAAAGAELSTTDAAPAASGEHGAAAPEGHGGGGDHGAAPAATGTVDKKKEVEIQVLDFRAINRQNNRTFFYDVTIFAVTKAEYKERVEAIITERKALITDRIRTIIAQCDPEKLGGGSEPGLETLRRQVKYQLDEVVGDKMIEEVLVPRCIPFRTDY